MNWIDYTFLFGGLTALIFNLVIFCLSFKREFPKVTQRITILFAGFGLGVGLYSIYKIVQTASITSPKLCGGIFVAIPTAIPLVPEIKRFGNLAGKTTGSFSLPS